jgi:ketosteroid isomerase-like protein
MQSSRMEEKVSKPRLSFILGMMVLAVSSSAFVASPQPQAAAEEEVLKVVRQFHQAALKPDAEFLNRVFDEEVTHFHPGSPYRYQGRERLVKEFLGFPQRATDITFEMINPHVQTIGNAAVVTYYISESWVEKGTFKSITQKATEIYAKKGNSWSLVHSHYSLN